MIKRKQKRPSRICFECTHYEACQAWNVGTLVETDATHCVNYRASVWKTNADRIRSMSDEELAGFFRDYVACDDCPVEPKKCGKGWIPCKDVALSWLKEEVSE